MIDTEPDIQTSLLWFAIHVLKLNPYDWQLDALLPFDDANQKIVRVTLVTPNGSGKSSMVIPILVLGWLFFYPKGRVALTTADFKQLENQVMPSLNAHQSKFPAWKFTQCRIENNTGGFLAAFTTNDERRVEGFHPESDLDGPLLVIVDESKTVSDEIFMSMDRCNYNALLLTSSPGPMSGRFYDTHHTIPGFIRIKAGLADCPHIKPARIKFLTETYGPDSAHPNPSFLASTLHGEFMEAEGELRFNRQGLDRIKSAAELFETESRRRTLANPSASIIGELHQQPNGAISWLADMETGWAWIAEKPIPGCDYIAFCDPTTGIQSEGSLKRDTAAAGILRLAYTDKLSSPPIYYEDEVVAVLHHEGGVRWENEIVAERLAILAKHYHTLVIVEMNNYGGQMITLLQAQGVPLWRRVRRDHKNPGKKMDLVGFQTTTSSKNEWIGAVGRGIREQNLVCNYLPAAQQFCTFILNEKGTGEAQPGCFDDFVTGVGLGLYARGSATRFPYPAGLAMAGALGYQFSDQTPNAGRFGGACL